MWRKLKFLNIWIKFKFLHMPDVKKSEISFVVCTIYGILLHFTLFCWNISFLSSIYAVLSQNRLLRFTHSCAEKNLAKNSARGEKMTNMRYETACVFNDRNNMYVCMYVCISQMTCKCQIKLKKERSLQKV